jgi:hypothetical protein
MAMEFIELKPFLRFKKNKKITKSMIDELKKELIEKPEKGDTISGTGGVQKIRLALKNTGKSGGARVIYFYLNINDILFLITGYLKTDKKDLTPEEKKEMKRLTTEIKRRAKELNNE